MGRGEEGVEALPGLVLAARDEVAVTVPGLAHVAVTSPRGDLLPVEPGGDEVRDRAVSGLVGRDRLKAGSLPRLVRPGPDRGRVEDPSCTSVRSSPPTHRAGGSRPSPAGAGLSTSASTAPTPPPSTVPGSYRTLSSRTDPGPLPASMPNREHASVTARSNDLAVLFKAHPIRKRPAGSSTISAPSILGDPRPMSARRARRGDSPRAQRAAAASPGSSLRVR
jgi:hypothetical protein